MKQTQVNNARIVLKRLSSKLPKRYFEDDWFEYIKDTARKIFIHERSYTCTGLSVENYETLDRLKRSPYVKRITKKLLEKELTDISPF